MRDIRVGIVTCSDRASAGEYEDRSGKALAQLAEERGWVVVGYHVVPDEDEAIVYALCELADMDRADLVLTTGGTGLGPRDVTPEATRMACDRDVPGIADHIRAESLKITGRAMLSRGVAAMRGKTLVVNMPGSEKAVREAFGFIADQIPHAVEMIEGGGH